MSARIVFHSAAAGVTAFLATACTIVNSTQDSGASIPDSGTTTDSGLTLETGVSADGSLTPETGTSDAGLGSDVAPSSDGAADQTAPPADGSQPVEASVGDGSGGDATLVVVGNGCADPPSTNQTPATATAYALATAFHGCLRSGTDVNYYSYTVPTSPPKGGYVVVTVSDVGLQGTIDLTAQAASDSTNIVNTSNTTAGGGVAVFFAAAPGATFRTVVKNRFNPPVASPETAYTLTATFTGVNDPSAPNGTVATATALTPATPVQGYFFAGYSSSVSPPAAAWEGWYNVMLPAGMASIALTNVPSDATGSVDFFDSNTQSLASMSNTTNGGNVQVNATTATAGLYYIRVQPRFIPAISGTGPNVPVFMMQPWTLTVTSH